MLTANSTIPTYTCERDGDNEPIIQDGRLLALDDPDMWLDESWNPAVAGLNMDGDYRDHYGRDPLHWVRTELEVCRNYHPMFMKMTGADDKYCHGAGAEWRKGGCVNLSGIRADVLSGNCCGTDH
jgi:hypothetical protein